MALVAPQTMPIFLDECSLCHCARPSYAVWAWLRWALDAQASPPRDAHERSYRVLRGIPPCCRSSLAMDLDGLEMLARLLRRRDVQERAVPYDESLAFCGIAPEMPRYMLEAPDAPPLERAALSLDPLLDQWQDGLRAAMGLLATARAGGLVATVSLEYEGRRRRDGLVPLFGSVKVEREGEARRLDAVFLGLLPCPAPGEFIPVEGAPRYPRMKEIAPRNVVVVTADAARRLARASLRSCGSLYGAAELLLVLEASEPHPSELEAFAEDVPTLRGRLGPKRAALREVLMDLGVGPLVVPETLAFMHGVLEKRSALEREVLLRRARKALGEAAPARAAATVWLPHCEGDATSQRMSVALCLARLLSVYMEVDIPDDECPSHQSHTRQETGGHGVRQTDPNRNRY